MKKLISSVFLATFCLLLMTSPTSAALINIDSQGQITQNILGTQDALTLNLTKRSRIEVTDVATQDQESEIKGAIYLEKTGDSYYLNDFDVTNFQSDLVEIQQRSETKRIKIYLEEGQIAIEQDGAIAKTDLPLTIDPKRNEFAIKTSSGSVFLTTLPIEAAESAVRSRFLTQVDPKNITLTETETGTLSYSVGGEKILDIFGFYDYEIPVTAHVSAATGEILNVDGPEWFKIFGFLFS